MAKRRLRWGRVAAAMCLVSGSIFLLDNFRRDLFKSESNNIVVSGDFSSNSTRNVEIATADTRSLGNESEPTTAFEGVANLGFSELSIPSSKLSTGALAVFTEDRPVTEVANSGMVNLYKNKNEYYTLVSETVRLNEDAAEAFNKMMEDYHTATGLADFIVYGTTDTFTGEGSFCPRYFPESATGNTVDLALNGYGSVIEYDGRDTESWVVDNCARYGFIVRYPQGKKDVTMNDYCPWHLRYVGNVHAAIMNEKGMCLEEYLEFLKDYTFDKAFSYSLDGVEYEIYSVGSMGDSTLARVPISGNYTISGNNSDGYIITTIKK